MGLNLDNDGKPVKAEIVFQPGKFNLSADAFKDVTFCSAKAGSKPISGSASFVITADGAIEVEHRDANGHRHVTRDYDVIDPFWLKDATP